MFLLLLMGLGAVGVKAQVRIGGNGVPNAAAVLDLNATDATTGTKGLALPRVSLSSNTAQITSGVANLTGMLVYNTTATLGGAGIYYWNGSTWVQASLPSTSAADSGFVLTSNGNFWLARFPLPAEAAGVNLPLLAPPPAISWTKVTDTTVVVTKPAGPYSAVYHFATTLPRVPLCTVLGNSQPIVMWTAQTGVLIQWDQPAAWSSPARIICYLPSS